MLEAKPIAAGAVYRQFTRDYAAAADHSVLAQFVALAILLASLSMGLAHTEAFTPREQETGKRFPKRLSPRIHFSLPTQGHTFRLNLRERIGSWQYTLYCKAYGGMPVRSRLVWTLVIGLLSGVVATVLISKLPGSIPAPERVATRIETMPAESTSEYEVVREYPHDTDAYTQGLIYLDGFLYESTGRTGQSTLRKARLETGEVVRKIDVNPGDFAEGLTEWRGTLIQLTPRRRGNAPIWHVRKFLEDLSRHFGRNVGVTYDLATLETRSNFSFKGEGWGITHDDRRLIMSDGTAKLRFLDPQTFDESGALDVFDGNKAIDKLNELEFVDGKIYANVWLEDRIAMIQPDSGQVTGWIDLAGLKSRMPSLSQDPQSIMNGIAYDAAGRRLFVTGKFWPKVFEIRLPAR